MPPITSALYSAARSFSDARPLSRRNSTRDDSQAPAPSADAYGQMDAPAGSLAASAGSHGPAFIIAQTARRAFDGKHSTALHSDVPAYSDADAIRLSPVFVSSDGCSFPMDGARLQHSDVTLLRNLVFGPLAEVERDRRFVRIDTSMLDSEQLTYIDGYLHRHAIVAVAPNVPVDDARELFEQAIDTAETVGSATMEKRVREQWVDYVAQRLAAVKARHVPVKFRDEFVTLVTEAIAETKWSGLLAPVELPFRWRTSVSGCMAQGEAILKFLEAALLQAGCRGVSLAPDWIPYTIEGGVDSVHFPRGQVHELSQLSSCTLSFDPSL